MYFPYIQAVICLIESDIICDLDEMSDPVTNLS